VAHSILSKTSVLCSYYLVVSVEVLLPKGLVEYPGFESSTVRCCGRPFHSVAAATQKLLVPSLVSVLLMKSLNNMQKYENSDSNLFLSNE
jgi:hypothetical protein